MEFTADSRLMEEAFASGKAKMEALIAKVKAKVAREKKAREKKAKEAKKHDLLGRRNHRRSHQWPGKKV
jgi:hypothetical protein